MSNQDQEGGKPLAHSYDGIQELDNPLPRWWLYAFYLCIVFAVLYTVFYWAGPGQSLAQVYDTRVQEIKALKASTASAGGDFDAALLTTIRSDATLRAATAAIYAEKCAACHGDVGQGVIGPNLTDAHWLHGGAPGAVLKTIRGGVGDKGMPAWGDLISPEDSAHLTAYILSLQGTNPPGAKEPQGELAKE